MPDSARSIAELGRRMPAAPKSPAEARARYFNTANAFDMKLPPVPDAVFTEEPARALDPDAPTGFVACDISAELACAFPATSPLVLARYARIRAGEALTADFNATGVLAYVIRGRGSVRAPGRRCAGRRATCCCCRAARRIPGRRKRTPFSGLSPTSRNSPSTMPARRGRAWRRPTRCIIPPPRSRSRWTC